MLIIHAQLTNGLIAYYPFNGNAHDLSGNNHHGTVYNAVLTADRNGNANSAYSFNGSNTRIEIPDNINFHMSNFTIAAWVKIDPISQTIVSKSYGNGVFNSFTIGYDNNALASAVSDGSSSAVYYSAPYSLSGNWFHYAVSFDDQNNEVKFFVNGSLISATTSNITLAYDNNILTIGCEYQNGVPAYFTSGKIDEVRVYNRPLTNPEIRELAGITIPAGSGTSMNFNGTNQNVVIPNNANLNFGLTQDFTIDFWLKIPSATQPDLSSNDNSIIEKWDNINGYPFIIRYQNQTGLGRIHFARFNGTISAVVGSIKTLNDDKYHHIAVQKSGTLLKMYIDGIFENSVNDLTTGSTQNNSNLYFANRNGFYYLKGELDEVRIWNTALTETQIKDWMCKKITSSHPAYANLVSYYRFDENTGAILNDLKGINHGTLVNNPVWISSGASIGDESAHNYSGSPNVTLTHPQGESMNATVTSGSPNGIHVYRVDAVPNTTNGIAGVGGNNRYFGVFVAGGSAPQYTATYNYTGNPFAEPLENSLLLFKRNDNSATSWTNTGAVLNTTTNTLTVTGQNTEYMLGSFGFPLPLTFLYFSAQKQNQQVLLQWQTVNEINTLHFEIERSSDGRIFERTGIVAAGNISGSHVYSFTDNSTWVSGTRFYRLKIVDIDGRFKYSNIIKLSLDADTPLTIFPNPATDVITISGLAGHGEITIAGLDGKEFLRQHNPRQSLVLNISKMPDGIYILQYTGSEKIKAQKLIIHH
jgi:hypothetical protein